MTNKPMLSKKCAFCGCNNEIPAASWGCVKRVEGQCWVCKRSIVWEALDKPAAQQQGYPEIPKHANCVTVLILQDGEKSYSEALYCADGKFRFGYDEDAITDVEKWMSMPGREQAASAVFAEPAAQNQGEPVAYRYVHDYEHGNGWQRNAVGFEQAKFVDDERKETWREITPLYAEQPAPVAVVMPDNLLSHRESWLQAMERLVALEAEATPPTHDSDEPGYWERELKAMRDMYADFDRLNGVKP